MKIYDQHCHSYLSFDSKADPFDYIDNNTEILVLTEHLDLENSVTGQDDIPDFEKMLEIKDQMLKEHGVELLMGVEVGYVPGQEERLESILGKYNFDLKLLSTHQRGDYDYMDSPSNISPKEMMDSYVDQMIKSVENFKDVQIFTHFDYGFRVHKFSSEDLMAYRDQFAYIFEELIKHDIALEINSRSITSYNNLDLYETALPFYKDLGGKLIALGSDCHVVRDKFLIFDQLISLAKSFGFDKLSFFKNSELTLVPIDKIEY